MRILGIETSCDETAASIYDTQLGCLSNELFSQIKEHVAYGGVVPEIASRSHLEKIPSIVQLALQKAQEKSGQPISLENIDTIAITNKPGLPGSLLIGLCFGKAIAYATSKKIIGINHLEGHIFSSFLSTSEVQRDIPFPHLCLTASGGHTALYLVKGFGDYELVAQTLDDAAGEAFDKIAKLMNLPYPGGPVIEKLAQEAGFQDFFRYPRNAPTLHDFSFSGLKTAVFYDLVKRGACDLQTKKFNEQMPDAAELKKQVASSLLVCITDIFKQKLAMALGQNQVKAITFVGGVAFNKYIRGQLEQFAQEKGIQFFAAEPQFCTDNGAMIAFVGSYKVEQGKFSDLSLDIFE